MDKDQHGYAGFPARLARIGTRLSDFWEALMRRRWPMMVLVLVGFALSFLIPRFGLLTLYVQWVLMFMGINIILAASLNLVNGYMGEFSVGHAGFMSVGAYISSILTVRVFPPEAGAWLFPVAVIAGGAAAALVSLMVALPSFRTRGDYLAIVTLAFIMIVKSSFENIDAVGGARGFLGMEKLTTLPWVFFWVVVTIWCIRNFVYSSFGRGVLAIREDEIAAELMGVNTRRVKLMTFGISSFFAGVAGALYAHLLLCITPKAFDIIKSTDILIMVYLGGIGSLGGSILGAAIYTTLLELPRYLEVWRMVLMPIMLVLLMQFRPRGIMGLRECRWLISRETVGLLFRRSPSSAAENRPPG